MRAEIFIHKSFCDRSTTFCNVSGSSLHYPHAQHPCYHDPSRGISRFTSLATARKNTSRTSYTGSNVRHPCHATLQTLAMKTQSFASYILPFQCVGRDSRYLRHSKPGAWKGSLYCKVYCRHTRSFADHTHRHTDIHSLFRRNMRTTGKVFWI
jgi:hypothetical protein